MKFYLALGIFYLATSMNITFGDLVKNFFTAGFDSDQSNLVQNTSWPALMAGLGNVLGQLPDPH